MEFLKNQTFRTNVKYVKMEDVDKKLSLNISINCNHELDKQTITDIEKALENMLILNYKKVDDYKEFKKDEKEKAKEEEKAKIKADEENKKLLKQQAELDRQMMKRDMSMMKKLKMKNIDF
mgnify:CR=1 FL=1